MKQKLFRSNQGYTTVEILLFLLVVTSILAMGFKPLQQEMKGMEKTRTEAAEAEISYRKERYLFESKPQKIDEFNQAGDETRWQILSQYTRRGDGNVKDPYAFIRFSGKSSMFIGRDSEEVRLQ